MWPLSLTFVVFSVHVAHILRLDMSSANNDIPVPAHSRTWLCHLPNTIQSFLGFYTYNLAMKTATYGYLCVYLVKIANRIPSLILFAQPPLRTHPSFPALAAVV